MDDDRQRRNDLGSAPTTPAPEGSIPQRGPEPAPRAPVAVGSGPDSTLDMPAADQVDVSGAPIGAAIGHFIVRARLGEGGMGVVLACEDADLGRKVALKLVRTDADHPAYRDRLLREAQAMARLEHPNVVKIYEVGSDRGRLFIAMELVDGVTLTAWLRQPRAWREILAIFAQVGAGLAAVHGAGLVHRDFKPDNVLIDAHGRARVADFGLARLDREGDASPIGQPLTRTGVVMGTPGYMAPEQQFGANVDARADQYSFCVALREALGGRPVDEARWAAVPRAVRDVVTRGLSYDPGDRFAAMTELCAALAEPRFRRRWVLAGVAVAAVGVAAGTYAIVSLARSNVPGTAVAAGSAAVASPGSAAVLPAPVSPPPAPVVPADAASARLPEHAIADLLAVADAGASPAHVARDAGVARAPRDAAAVQASAAPPGPTPGTPPAAPPAGLPADAGLHIQIPTSKHLPAAQVGDPGHLPIVRAAIKDLGYDGYDGKITQAEVDAATGVDHAIAEVKLGMVKRRHGDCTTALPLWEDAVKVLHPYEPPEEAPWNARAWFGRGLCALAAGNAADAWEHVLRAWNRGDKGEVGLVMGMAAYDKGDKDVALGQLMVADMKGNATVKAALKIWLDGMGLTLR